MNLIRRALLALVLAAGIFPAFAQAPAPVPALPDTERRTSYTISGTTCACAVNFALYGDSTDYQNWVQVWLNGVLLPYNDPANGWTITSPSGSLTNLPRPITDAVLTFTIAQTGTVQIVGARRPRRVSQVSESRGVAARDFNQIITDLTAQNREVWDKINDVTGRTVLAPPGSSLANFLPPLASRLGLGTCWDNSGNLTVCASVPSSTFSAGNGITFTGTNPTVISTGVIAFQPQFGGRLTLISGQPEMTADAVGAQTIYLAPDTGPYMPIYNGSAWVSCNFTSGVTDQVGLSLALAGSASWPANTIFDIFGYWNGSACALATRAWDSSMLPSAPAQITNVTTITSGTTPGSWTNPGNAFNGTINQTGANSAVFSPSNNSSAHCLGQDWGAGNPKAISQMVLTAPTDFPIRGDLTTYLPIVSFGSNDNTNWTIIDQRNINSSANGTSYTLGINARFVVPYRYVRLCIAGDGSHGIRVSQLQFYTTAGPATRRLTKSNGIKVNDAAIPTARINATTTVNIPQYQGTFLGVFQTDTASAGQVSAYVNPGPSRVYNIWNDQNQRTITLQAVVPFTVTGIGPNSYTLSSTSFGYIQSTSTFSLSALIGYAQDPVSVTLLRAAYMNTTGNGAGYVAGIGLDSNNNISGTEFSMTTDSTGAAQGFQGSASLTLPPFYGTHTFYGVEYNAYAPSGTLSAFTNILNTNMTASWKG